MQPLEIVSKIECAQQSVHLTGGDAKRQCALAGRCSLEAHSPDLRHFQALSTPKQNPALEVFSTSAHPQVPLQGASRTQTVGLQKKWEIVFRKTCVQAKYRKGT
jgi:hypothetical protein